MENRYMWETRFRIVDPDDGSVVDKLDVSINVNESGMSREQIAELFEQTSLRVFEIIAMSDGGTGFENEECESMDDCFSGKRKGWFR